MPKLTIALLVGSDLTAHLVVNTALPALVAAGHHVTVYYTSSRPNPDRPAPLRELFFVEHELLRRYVYPHWDTNPQPSTSRSPAGLAASWPSQVRVRQIGSVNADAFVREVARRRFALTVSVRCYQKFGRPLIEACESSGVFTNLHPGFLPAYRGVLTFSRALLAGDDEAGFTLHHVDERWDAGPVIAGSRQKLDHGQSVLENMCAHRWTAAELVVTAADTLAGDERLRSAPQDEAMARYFTHLTPAELAELEAAGIALVRTDAVIDLLVDEFGDGGLRRTLVHAVDQYTRDQERQG
jgi:hypothetical protein